MPVTDPAAMKENTMNPAAGLPTVVQNMDWFGRGDANPVEPAFVRDRDQPNYSTSFGEPLNSTRGYTPRESGGNLMPGQGYSEHEVRTHSVEPTFVRDQPDHQNNFEPPQNSTRGNAREGGGNPITGQGYTADNAPHSMRRQFQQPSTKLW